MFFPVSFYFYFLKYKQREQKIKKGTGGGLSTTDGIEERGGREMRMQPEHFPAAAQYVGAKVCTFIKFLNLPKGGMGDSRKDVHDSWSNPPILSNIGILEGNGDYKDSTSKVKSLSLGEEANCTAKKAKRASPKLGSQERLIWETAVKIQPTEFLQTKSNVLKV
jgi:hypothetical protein